MSASVIKSKATSMDLEITARSSITHFLEVGGVIMEANLCKSMKSLCIAFSVFFLAMTKTT